MDYCRQELVKEVERLTEILRQRAALDLDTVHIRDKIKETLDKINW